MKLDKGDKLIIGIFVGGLLCLLMDYIQFGTLL